MIDYFTVQVTSNDVSMVVGFLVGLFGSRFIDYLTDRWYYRGSSRNGRLKVVKKDED